MKQAEDELTAAADELGHVIDDMKVMGRRHIDIDIDQAELIRQLLEGEAARWAPRPVDDLATYLMSPACKLARHILEKP